MRTKYMPLATLSRPRKGTRNQYRVIGAPHLAAPPVEIIAARVAGAGD
jgi:hypothetical protein